MKIEFTAKQIEILRENYAKIQSIDPCGPAYEKLIQFLNRLQNDTLKQIANSDIRWLSPIARNRLERI